MIKSMFLTASKLKVIMIWSFSCSTAYNETILSDNWNIIEMRKMNSDYRGMHKPVIDSMNIVAAYYSENVMVGLIKIETSSIHFWLRSCNIFFQTLVSFVAVISCSLPDLCLSTACAQSGLQLETLSQHKLLCRLSRPLCRDSRDCHDQGGPGPKSVDTVGMVCRQSKIRDCRDTVATGVSTTSLVAIYFSVDFTEKLIVQMGTFVTWHPVKQPKLRRASPASHEGPARIQISRLKCRTTRL